MNEFEWCHSSATRHEVLASNPGYLRLSPSWMWSRKLPIKEHFRNVQLIGATVNDTVDRNCFGIVALKRFHDRSYSRMFDGWTAAKRSHLGKGVWADCLGHRQAKPIEARKVRDAGYAHLPADRSQPTQEGGKICRFFFVVQGRDTIGGDVLCKVS